MKKFILIFLIGFLQNNLKSQCTISFSLNTSTGGYTLPCNPSSMIVNIVNTSTVFPVSLLTEGPLISTSGSSYTCTVPGTYTVTMWETGAPTCIITQTFAILQNSLAPNVTVTPSSTSLICNGSPVTFSAICNPTANVTGEWLQINYVPITAPSISLSFTTTSPGIYTARYKDNSNGCVGAKTVLALNTGTPTAPSLTLSAYPSATIGCGAFSTPTLNPMHNNTGAPYSYTYTNLTTSLTVNYPWAATTNGYYLIEMRDGNFCYCSLTMYIGTNTVAPIINITGTNTLCSGYSNTLTANGAASYTWNTGANTNSVVISPSITTNYNVKGTDAVNGCTNTATFTQTVSPCAGIEELFLENNISVYPNPVSNILFISSEQNEFKNLEIEITNVLGQTVYKLAFTKEIDVSKLEAGLYYLKISGKNKENYYSKFIKE